MLFCKLICLLFVTISYGQILKRHRYLSPLKWKRRFLEKTTGRQICYDVVGCFDLPHMLAPLKKVPENPSALNTKFYLFKRNLEFSNPETLTYDDDGLSVRASKIDVNHPTKVIIHGYTGSWIDDGPLNTAKAYLQLSDCNVIIVDWEKGARGSQYANAAANTEVVGRQLGILLLHMIDKGLHPGLFHLIGFSLGAHVAGCAAEVVKNQGLLIGRITGLDAASPLFRHNHFREKSKKLDKGDAVFVDAIHTDASPFFADGFGLLEPIGHVDFFPNGGFEQPGCADRRASVVMTHLEKTISKETACSHLRSWQLFLESLKMKLEKTSSCDFVAFKCKNGLDSFQKGLCFPNIESGAKSLLNSSYRSDLGKMGEDAKGDGIMYLVTNNQYPFCGTQLQVSVIFKTEKNVIGDIRLNMKQGNVTASTTIRVADMPHAFGLFALGYKGFNINDDITANVVFLKEDDGKDTGKDYLDTMTIDKVTIRNIEGNSWFYCNKQTLLKHGEKTTILLKSRSC